MRQVLNNIATDDLLTILGNAGGKNSKSAKASFEQFAGMLTEAIEKGKPSTREDSKPTDAAMADTAAAAMQPEAQPAQTDAAPEADQAIQVVNAAAHATVQIAPNVAEELIPQQQSEQQTGGDILSFEAVSESPVADLPVTQTVVQTTDPQAQQRFDTMLDEAQQQLQQIAAPETPEVQQELAEKAAPVIVTDETADVETTEARPVEIAPVDEEAKTFERPQTAQQSTQPQQVQTEQKPLREMPDTDRAVMQMRDTRSEERQPVEVPSQPQRTAEPQAVQAAQEVPQEQPARTDQTEQIRLQVTENLEKDVTEFRMQLQPEELGKISVKLTIEGGRLAVEIMAASTRTADLLTRQAETLGHALRVNTGLDVDTVQVVQQADNASGQMYGAFNPDAQAEQGGFQSSGSSKTANAAGEAGVEAETNQTEPAETLDVLLDYTV